MFDLFEYANGYPKKEYLDLWDSFYAKCPSDMDSLWLVWYQKSYAEWRASLAYDSL